MPNEEIVEHPSKSGESVTQLEKFMFNVSFDDDAIAAAKAEAEEAKNIEIEEEYEPEIEAPTFSEDQVDAARQEGFDKGREEGIREAADAIETKINDTLGMIGAQFTELFHRQTVGNAETFSDAVNIAVAISRKCFPHFTEIHGLEEVVRMVSHVLTEVLEEPRVIIHISPEMKIALNDRLEPVAKDANFEGQIILLESEDIASGDCRITWSSGSAERDMDSVWSRLDEIIEQNLNAVKDEAGSYVPGADGAQAPPADAEAGAHPASESVSAETPMTPVESPPAAPETSGHVAAPETTEPEAIEPEAASQTPTDSPDSSIAETQGPPETVDSLAFDDDAGPAPAPPTDLGDGDAGVGEPAPEEPLTEAHLQAGPGSVEPIANEGILEPDSAAGDETEPDAATPSVPDAPDGEQREP